MGDSATESRELFNLGGVAAMLGFSISDEKGLKFSLLKATGK